VLDLARHIRDLTSSSSSIHFVDLPEDDPRLRRPDLTVAHEELRWAPRTRMRDGLSRTVRWIADELETHAALRA
ncbi:MAG: rfbB, partial [Nocardioides sp.]|nr:rfbB [Nocardioides sp.]